MSFSRFSTHQGQDVLDISLVSPKGGRAKIMTFGATLRDLQVPTRNGLQRVVLGFPDFDSYRDHGSHFGAIAGRYGNRIAQGKFVLDEKTYQLPLNQGGKHSLHGGGEGFGRKNWTLVATTENSATLALVSPDGEAGYPGELTVLCKYSLAESLVEQTILRIELTASTDARTVLNLCHHSYFNLDGSPDILDHTLAIRANLMTPVDGDLIPNGALAPVGGTPFDFRVARPIRMIGGDGQRCWYDHNFMLRRDRREPSVASGLEIAHAATLASPKNGLVMEVWTTEPGLQIYDAAKMNTPVAGLDGKPYGACAALAMEPQHVPDSPNLPHFPTTELSPGDLYRQVTEYRFG